MADGEANITQVEEFLEEGMMMKDFQHEHVLSLIGVAIQGNNPRIVLPFMEFGSLKDFLKNTNHVSNNPRIFLPFMENGNLRKLIKSQIL